MTREQAVKWLKEALRQTDFQCEQMETAVEMAISALEQPCETSTDESMTMVYPTIFCDDCVSREAVVEAIDKWYENNRGEAFFDDYIEDLIIAVTYLPSVQPSRKGHWIAVYQGDEIINYRCSECELGDTNGSTDLYGWDYCRRCGADMER